MEAGCLPVDETRTGDHGMGKSPGGDDGKDGQDGQDEQDGPDREGEPPWMMEMAPCRRMETVEMVGRPHPQGSSVILTGYGRGCLVSAGSPGGRAPNQTLPNASHYQVRIYRSVQY